MGKRFNYVKLKSYGGPNVHFYGGSSLPPGFILSDNVFKVIFKTGQNKKQNSRFLLEYLQFGESKVF